MSFCVCTSVPLVSITPPVLHAFPSSTTDIVRIILANDSVDEWSASVCNVSEPDFLVFRGIRAVTAAKCGGKISAEPRIVWLQRYSERD
jgi:hypothetical protein